MAVPVSVADCHTKTMSPKGSMQHDSEVSTLERQAYNQNLPREVYLKVP